MSSLTFCEKQEKYHTSPSDDLAYNALSLKYINRMHNLSHIWQERPRSSCAFLQSDQTLRCPLYCRMFLSRADLDQTGWMDVQVYLGIFSFLMVEGPFLPTVHHLNSIFKLIFT